MSVRTVQLGELIESAAPGFASGEDLRVGVAQLRMNNVTRDGTLDWTEIRRVPADSNKIAKYGLRSGDVVFNSTNSPELVGKTALFTGFKEPVLFSNHFLRLRVDREIAEPGFVAWWLNYRWQRRAFENLCTRWVNQASVRKEDLLEQRIELPSLPEQKRIAGILEQADRLRRTRRYALELSDTLLPAAFLALFGDPVRNTRGWPTCELADIADVQGGLQLSAKRNALPLKKPFLRVANVQRGFLDLTEIKLIGLTEAEYRRTILRGNDLLLVEGNGNPAEVGRAAKWDGSIPECVHQNHLIRVRCDETKILPDFLLALLNGPRGMDYYLKHGHTTSGLVTISTGLVNDFPSLLPPLDRQRHFAALVERHEHLRAKQREALRQAEHLFQSLLHRAFGEGI